MLSNLNGLFQRREGQTDPFVFEFFVAIFVFEKWALAIFNLGFWQNLVDFGQFLWFVAIFGQKKWAIGHF